MTQPVTNKVPSVLSDVNAAAPTRIWQLEPDTQLRMAKENKVPHCTVLFEENYGSINYRSPSVGTRPGFVVVGLAIVSLLVYLLRTGQVRF